MAYKASGEQEDCVVSQRDLCWRRAAVRESCHGDCVAYSVASVDGAARGINLIVRDG